MHVADQAVHEVLEIAADRDQLWRAWTDPAWLCGWLVERVHGAVEPGRALQWRWDSLGLELDLEVVASEPPARLVLRGGRPGRPPRTQSVSLVKVAGGTRVELTHEGFAAPVGNDHSEREGTAAGWRVMLRVLAHYLAGGGGRRRESASAIAPVAVPLHTVGRLLFDPGERARWLTDRAALAAEGERFTLREPDGASLSGRVIALAAPFEIALSWEEIDGVLILRAIQVAPGGPVLAVAQAWSWSPERAAWGAARGTIERVLARLVSAAGGAPGASA